MTVYRQSAHNFGWNVKELDDGLFVNVNPIHYESCNGILELVYWSQNGIENLKSEKKTQEYKNP